MNDTERYVKRTHHFTDNENDFGMDRREHGPD